MNKQYANKTLFSDVYPYEVVRVISEKTLEIRAMKYERDPSFKPEFDIGGFAGHCTNQSEQRHIYSSNPDAGIRRIRLNKKGWQDKYGDRYSLSDSPRYFRDFNF